MPKNIQKQNSGRNTVFGFGCIFVAGCLLVSVLIIPIRAQSDNKVKITAYLQSDIDEAKYRTFLQNINRYYADNGISVNFSPERIERYPIGGSCGNEVYGNDVIMCVGPGKGGYVGPPWFVSGANTNRPFGFTATGIRAEAHELAHFFGFPDLYWLKTLPPLIAPPPPSNNVMVDVYSNGSMFGFNAKYVIEMNLARLNSGGRNSILYPVSRVAKKLRVQINGGRNKTCKIYTRQRNYEKFRSQINGTPSLTINTDSSGIFEMDIIGGDSVDNNFDLYYVSCGLNEFWINSLATESCYAANGANSACDIVCLESGKWCVFSPIQNMLGGMNDTIDNFPQDDLESVFKHEEVSDENNTDGVDVEIHDTVGHLNDNDPNLNRDDFIPPEMKDDSKSGNNKKSFIGKMMTFCSMCLMSLLQLIK